MITPIRLINKEIKRLRKAQVYIARQIEIHGDNATEMEQQYARAIPAMITFLECAERSPWHRSTNNPSWFGQSSWQDAALALAESIVTELP